MVLEEVRYQIEDQKNYLEAAEMLEELSREHEHLHRYGSRIYSKLAYCYANVGNKVLAEQSIEIFNDDFEYFGDNHECDMIK